MTPFRALYTLLGLSQDRAERLLGANHGSIEHWMRGERRRGEVLVPCAPKPGVLDEMRRCWLAIEAHADAVLDAWRARPSDVLAMPPVPAPAIRGDWSAIHADALAAGLLALDLPDHVRIEVVPRGSTPAAAAASPDP